jgi:hypothetical protein
MSWYRKNGRYYFVPEEGNEQEINQEAKAKAEIEAENENEAEAKNRSSQGDTQRVKITNTGTNINVNGPTSNGQIANINQTTGADTNSATQAPTAPQTVGAITAVPVAVPVNTGDQTQTVEE